MNSSLLPVCLHGISPLIEITDKLIYQAVFERLSGDCCMSKSAVLDLVKVEKINSESRMIQLFRAWTIPIIKSLGGQSPSRFNELKRKIKGISSTSLSERLSALENDKIVQRVVIPDNPPRVEYSLTSKGLELHTILVELGDWIDKWNDDSN